jgi:hypothetical protein
MTEGYLIHIMDIKDVQYTKVIYRLSKNLYTPIRKFC